jgi:hypothetical protein
LRSLRLARRSWAASGAIGLRSNVRVSPQAEIGAAAAAVERLAAAEAELRHDRAQADTSARAMRTMVEQVCAG